MTDRLIIVDEIVSVEDGDLNDQLESYRTVKRNLEQQQRALNDSNDLSPPRRRADAHIERELESRFVLLC
jgi:hypothetical protein